jgi:hypothetical protein
MMRRLVLVIAVVVFGVPLGLLATAPDALACSCAPEPFSAQVGSSVVVFTGEAFERAERAPRGDVVSSLDPVTWTFRVHRVHKGSADELQPVVSARSEASCGSGFDIGATYVVLADEQPDGSLATGLCHGTQKVTTPSAEVQALGAGEPPRTSDPVAEPAAPLESVAVAWWQAAVAGLAVVVVAGLAAGTVLRRRRRPDR